MASEGKKMGKVVLFSQGDSSQFFSKYSHKGVVTGKVSRYPQNKPSGLYREFSLKQKIKYMY